MRLGRVLAMLGLAVAAGIALVWIEGQNLRLKQKASELYHERELLAERQAQLRLTVSRLANPKKVLESVRDADTSLKEPQLPVAKEPRANLPLHLQR